MRAGKSKLIVLTVKNRKVLEALIDRPGVPLRVIVRARIILLSATGITAANIASRLGVSASTIHYWRNRFLRGGLDGVIEKPKITRRRHDDTEIRKVVETTLRKWPVKGRRWSVRNLSKFLGISRSVVQRIWKSYGLKPIDGEFKFRHDDAFYLKTKDIAGVYMASEDAFAVALLSESPGVPATTALPSATSVDAGRDSTLISRVLRFLARRPAPHSILPEFIDFLKWTHSHTPPDIVVHLIVPRRAQKLFPPAFRWLKRHPRFQLHVIPRDVNSRIFLGDWFARTSASAARDSSFSGLALFREALVNYLESYSSSTLGDRPSRLARPFLWVRPDRNYQADVRQPELALLPDSDASTLQNDQ